MHNRHKSSILCLILVFAMLILLTSNQADANRTTLPQSYQDRIMAMAYTHELDRNVADSYLEVITRAYGMDIPIRPLLMKIQEGLSKNVPHQNIFKAVEQICSRFERFDAILDKIPHKTDIDRKSLLNRMNSLAAMGVAEDEISYRLQSHPDYKDVINALEIREALVNAGMSREDARSLIDAGLKSGYFNSPGWGMTRITRAALEKGVPESEVRQFMLGLVRGEIKEKEAASKLGVDQGRVAGHGRSGSITGRSRTQSGHQGSEQRPGLQSGSTGTGPAKSKGGHGPGSRGNDGPGNSGDSGGNSGGSNSGGGNGGGSGGGSGGGK